MEKADPFSVRADKIPTDSNAFNPNNKQFKDSKWFFDTPGTVNHDQVFIFFFSLEIRMSLF